MFSRGSARAAGLCMVLSLIAAGSILRASGAPPASPAPGGVLRVAHSGEPPTLDLHWTTGGPTQDVAIHLYEGLFALSSRYEPKPMLVERWTVSTDRRTYTFHLRRGVLFHRKYFQWGTLPSCAANHPCLVADSSGVHMTFQTAWLRMTCSS